MLLDFAEFPAAARQWWNREDLAQIWAGAEVGDEDAGWANHVEQASKTIEDIRQGNERLGTQPDDLFDTLAVAASAGPASIALRAYTRTGRGDGIRSLALRDAAARTGRALLSLFNHAEVIEAVSDCASDSANGYIGCIILARGRANV